MRILIQLVTTWEKRGVRSCYSISMSLYLCKRLLAVVLQVLRVDVEVIVVDCERLRTFGYAWHKLLHFKEDVGLLAHIKLLHRNVGWGNTIYTQKQEGGGGRNQINRLQTTWPIWSEQEQISFSHIGCTEGIQRAYLSSRVLHCQW